MACQRSTSAVCYILSRAGCQVCSYLDDFIGVAPAARASRDYYHCGSLLTELGLQESPSKACPPSTCMTCLGVQVNIVDMTLSVTPERLNELEMLLSHWLTKKSALKSELQSLVGNCLLFQSVFVRAVFFSHIFLLCFIPLSIIIITLNFHGNFIGTFIGGCASFVFTMAFPFFRRLSGLLLTLSSPLTRVYPVAVD